MATFGTLKTRISNKIDTTDPASLLEIGDAINSAIEFFEEKHLFFNEAVATITLTQGVTTLPNLPSDFLYEFSGAGLVIVDNKLRYILQKITHEERAAVNVETNARPNFYTAQVNDILLYPFPDQAYTLELYYIKKYTDLVADGDSNDWTNNAARLLEAKVLADVYLDQRHSTDMNLTYERQVTRELKSLQARNRQNLGTGRLKVQSLNYDNGVRTSRGRYSRIW